jgi:hypothetical protein
VFHILLVIFNKLSFKNSFTYIKIFCFAYYTKFQDSILNSFAVAYTTYVRMTGVLFVLGFRYTLLEKHKILWKHNG